MKRILFVDDHLYFRDQLHGILHTLGKCEVLGFEYGRELIEYYQTQYEKKENIDLLFIDCTMTDLSGFDTLIEVMKINPGATVIMMTGVHHQNVIDGLKLGAKWFIWKPFDEENIKEALVRFL